MWENYWLCYHGHLQNNNTSEHNITLHVYIAQNCEQKCSTSVLILLETVQTNQEFGYLQANRMFHGEEAVYDLNNVTIDNVETTGII